MTGMTDVCKDCQERYPACWGSCTKYQQAKADYEKRKQDRTQAISRNCTINSVQYNGLKRKKKER